MSGRNIVMVIIIVGALVVAGVLVAKQLSGTETSSEGLEQVQHYACRDCKQDFTITLAEFMDHQTASGEAPVPCKNCSSINTSPGEPCWSCGRTLITGSHGQMPEKCPHCGKGMADDSPNTGTP